MNFALDFDFCSTNASNATRLEALNRVSDNQARVTRALVKGERTVAFYLGVDVGRVSFVEMSLVHHEDVDVQLKVADGQGIELGGHDLNVQSQDTVPIKIPELAQGHSVQTHRLARKALATKTLDRFEFVLSQRRKSWVALEQIAVIHPRVLQAEHGRSVDPLNLASQQGQTNMAAQIVSNCMAIDLTGSTTIRPTTRRVKVSYVLGTRLYGHLSWS